MKVKIITRSGEIELPAEPAARLDDLLLSAGLLFNRPCGGAGRCGKCRVTAGGQLSPPSALEAKHLSASELERGVRLACQARVTGEAELMLEAGLIVTDKNFRDDEDLVATYTLDVLISNPPHPPVADADGPYIVDAEHVMAELVAQGRFTAESGVDPPAV